MARTQPEELQASFFRIRQDINSNQPEEEQQQLENTVTQQVIDVNCNASKINIYKDDLQEKCLHADLTFAALLGGSLTVIATLSITNPRSCMVCVGSKTDLTG